MIVLPHWDYRHILITLHILNVYSMTIVKHVIAMYSNIRLEWMMYIHMYGQLLWQYVKFYFYPSALSCLLCTHKHTYQSHISSFWLHYCKYKRNNNHAWDRSYVVKLHFHRYDVIVLYISTSAQLQITTNMYLTVTIA